MPWYTGQMKAVLHREAPAVAVIDLFADAPSRNPRAAAYLLAAYGRWFPAGTVILSVVDPGVGGARTPLIVEADGRWYVGPDNGLFEIVLRQSSATKTWAIDWRPADLSASFHGRDLFAPVAARLARGAAPPGKPHTPDRKAYAHWPDDLGEVVYLDHYGNAITGLRASTVPAGSTLLVSSGRRVAHARTFADVPPGTAFWYQNANGLVEIAVNLGRADRSLGLVIGSSVSVADGT